MSSPEANWEQFQALDIRVGTIVEASPFPEARTPAYILHIDFGALGIKKSSAQITDLYSPSTLLGKQVIAVVNFPAKQIGPHQSECLVLGAVEPEGVKLLGLDIGAQNGSKIS